MAPSEVPPHSRKVRPGSNELAVRRSWLHQISRTLTDTSENRGASTRADVNSGIIAGLYFPVALLPDWVEWTSEVQPFTPSVDLLRNLIVGTPLADSAWLDLLKLVGFATVLLPASAWLLSRAVRAGQRRGTILEY